MSGDLDKFREEYPLTAAEAFRATSRDSFILPSEVVLARKTDPAPLYDAGAPLIVGLDVGREVDRSVFAWRRGRVIERYEEYRNKDGVWLAKRAKEIIKADAPKRLAIDGTGGYGLTVYDILNNDGYHDIVRSVNFGASADDERAYKNKRAEMYAKLKEWLNSTPCSIPDSDDVEMELVAARATHDVNGLLQIEKKEEITKRLRRSPDIMDAILLTFAETIAYGAGATNSNWAALSNRNFGYDF
jgi:hypothetical protein